MKERFKNWWNRPITRGDYVKVCVYSTIASAAVYVAGVIAINHQMKRDNPLDFDLNDCVDDEDIVD